MSRLLHVIPLHVWAERSCRFAPIVGEWLLPGNSGSVHPPVPLPYREEAGDELPLPYRLDLRGRLRRAVLLALGDVGVDLGCRDAGVSEQILETLQVSIVLQLVHGKGVAQGLGGDVRINQNP